MFWGLGPRLVGVWECREVQGFGGLGVCTWGLEVRRAHSEVNPKPKALVVPGHAVL